MRRRMRMERRADEEKGGVREEREGEVYKGGESEVEGRRGEALMKMFLSLGAALLVYDLGKQAGLWAVSLVPGLLPEGPTEETQALRYGVCSMAMQLSGGGLCAFLWRKQLFRGRRVHSQGKNPESGEGTAREKIGKTAAFLCLAVTSALGLNMLFSLLRLARLSGAFQETAASQAAVPLLLGLLLYGFAAPLSEELVFRGIVYGQTRKTLGCGGAMALSALVFGIYHGNPVQGIYAFLLGLLLALVYERAGGLRAAVLFHGLGNLAVYWLIDIRRLSLGPPALTALCAALALIAAGCFAVCFGKFKPEKGSSITEQ